MVAFLLLLVEADNILLVVLLPPSGFTSHDTFDKLCSGGLVAFMEFYLGNKVASFGLKYDQPHSMFCYMNNT